MLCLLPPGARAEGHVYPVAQLNPGLPPAPDFLDRTTPQGVMEMMFEAARTGDWAGAAHLLDLRDIPEERQATQGPQLAAALWQVIDRKVTVDWSALLDRPDAMNARETSDSAVAGQPRRSLLLWSLDLDGRPVPIRMNRVAEPDSAPVWVFSRQTVRNIPGLARTYRPSWLEQQLPDVLREKTIGGLFWWELIALPLALIIAILTGWLMHRGVRALSKRAERKLSRAVIRSLGTPLVIAALTTVLAGFAGSLFVFSGRIDMVLTPLVAIGYVSAVLMLVVNVLDAVLDQIITFDEDALGQVGDGLDHSRRTATRIAAARRALIVIITLIGAGVVLSSSNLFQTFGFSLLASAGAITIIVGFAARNVLGNIMSSLQIALNQSARLGDKIVYKGYLCTVERINFTFVQLRVWTGERLVVPVGEFAGETFENWMLQSPEMVRTIELKLDHRADVDRLSAAYTRILDEGADQQDWKLGAAEARGVYVSGHDVFGMDVLFKVPTADPNSAWDIACAVRQRLLAEARRLEEEEGLRIFPEAAAAGAAG